ncbi:MAG: FGGY-family carbohydrate kinase, partial [Anaerolineales bacterium]|nr:FGGY-family carbohydrate kinase [Anaerolineales bacterium]MDW8446099.1 FGGY-family carbohydrate kinase [Anaerolineales bacterium]
MVYILAFDVGTSGCKAALVCPDGELQGTAFEPYPTYYPRALWAEQNPEDWWEAVCKTTRRILAENRVTPSEIAGLAFSTQMVNLLPIDREGQPLRPCISWLDGRAEEEAEQIMRRVGGRAIFTALVGVAITGKDVLPKYIWLKKHEPEIYRRAAALVDCSGYLLTKTTGRLVAEWTVSSVTGVFNLKTKTWDTALMRFLGLDPSKFPELVLPYDQVGGLRRQAAQAMGLLEGTPVFGGAGDAMTAAVGSGAVGEGEGHLCLGTSGFVGIVTSKRVVGKRGIPTIQSADPQKLLLIAETETAGACLKWAGREFFQREPDSELFARMDEEVSRVEAGAGKLIFTPWMYGERTPIADERLRAAFINLGANHTYAHMLRAVYEGVGYNVRWIVENIAELYGFRPDPLRTMGGGAKGLPWVQIVADITGRTLECVAQPQHTTALGAA